MRQLLKTSLTCHEHLGTEAVNGKSLHLSFSVFVTLHFWLIKKFQNKKIRNAMIFEHLFIHEQIYLRKSWNQVRNNNSWFYNNNKIRINNVLDKAETKKLSISFFTKQLQQQNKLLGTYNRKLSDAEFKIAILGKFNEQ